MSKVRVYEVAKQLNMDQKQLVAMFQAMGLTDVKNHMSAVEPDAVDRLKRQLEKQKQPAVVEERIRGTVIRRKAAPKPEAPEAPAAVPAPAPSQSVQAVAAVPPARASASSPQRVAAPPAERPSGRVEIPAERRSAPVASPPPAPPSQKVEALPPEPPAAPAKEAPVKAASTPAPAEEKKAPSTPAPVEEKKAPSAPAPAPVAAAPEQPAVAAEKPAERPAASPPPPAPQPAASTVSASTSVNIVTAVTSQPEALPLPVIPPAPPVPTKAAPEPVVESPAPPPAVAAAPAPSPAPAPAPVAAAPAPVRAPEPPRSAAPPPSSPPVGGTRAPAPSRPPGAPNAPRKTGIEVWSGRPGVPMPPPPEPRPMGVGPRRSVQDIRPQTGGRPGMGPRPGGTMPPPSGGIRPGMGPGGRPGGPGQQRRWGPQARPGAGTGAILTKDRSAEKKVIKIEDRVSLQTLAARMSLKATEVLMKLIQMGMPGVNINTSLDEDTAKLVAAEFGWEVENVAVSEEVALDEARGKVAQTDEGSEPRPPIVTVMGHVDHGKTSLLDQIRKANVAGGEAGGITQHIGAYRVQTSKGPITFLDTPGHEAFTAMRARGASVTDIVVLVVAADDGVMPQTREAVAHARAAKVPIVVAINKIDKPEANPEKVKRQLMEMNLVPEDLGGDTIYCEVSAKTRLGVDALLEMLALQAEVMELKANPTHPAHAVVVEALLDRGKGPVARVIVLDGTLKTGDFVLSGPAVGKIRAMTDDRGRTITSAGPATPVELLGLSDVPNAGEDLDVVKDTKKAQEIAEQRKAKQRTEMSEKTSKRGLDYFADRVKKEEQVELRIIIKADVRGSAEALSEALSRLSGDKVKLTIVDASVGAINESDVNLAIASKAIIIGFNVRPAGKAASLAENEGVEIRQYSIIYNAIDEVRAAMEGLLAPTLVEKPLGKAEVRQVFKLTKAGIVAGSMVIEGVIKRGARVRVRRAGVVVHEGKLSGLKRFKDDVKDVAEGFECGISIDNFEEIKDGDILEVFEVEEVRQKL